MPAPRRYYVIVFEKTDPPLEMKKFLKDNRGFELSTGTWIFLRAQHFADLYEELRSRMPERESFVAASVSSEEDFFLTHNRDDLKESLLAIGITPHRQ